MLFENPPHVYNDTDFLTQSPDECPNSCSLLLNSIVIPRPIAFVTTLGATGIVNAAPFSYFNLVCTHPSIISLSIGRKNNVRKDTSSNILATKEFVINICSTELAKAVSIASTDFSPDVSEVEIANLSLISSHIVSPPRIANTLVQMECVLNQVIEVGPNQTDLILGQVIKIHLHKDILNAQSRIDVAKLNPLARIAGPTYARVCDFFEVFNNASSE